MCVLSPGSRAGLLAVLACCLGVARAQADLPLEQAVAEALAHSPRLRAAEQAAATAGAAARAAGLLPGPRLQAGPLYSDERGLDFEAVLSQPLFDATLKPAARAARAALAAALCDVEEQRLEVIAAVGAAWHRLASAQRLAAAIGLDVDLARALREAAAKARDVGERPGVDVLRAELEVGLAEQALADATAEVTLARGALAGLLGRQSGAELTVSTDAQLLLPTLDRAALLAQAAARPRLRAARLRVEEARGLVALARSQRAPGVSVEGFREDQEHGLRIAVDLPIFDHGRIAGEVRVAETGVPRAEVELAAATREVELAVDAAWLAAETASQRRASYAAGVLQRAERLAELTRVGYQSGELSLLEVLDARRRLAEARLGAVALDTALSTALLDLRCAVGGDLRGAVGGDLPAGGPMPTPVPPAAAEPGPLGPPVPATSLNPQSARPTAQGAP